MTETKHTPGPWNVREINPNNFHFASVQDNDCALLFQPNHSRMRKYNEQHGIAFDERRLADARLIAAAPELLWFAVQMLENGDMITMDSPADETLANVLVKGRAAIAKARGKS